MGNVYGYMKLRNQRELELFEVYQSTEGKYIDNLYFDIVLGKTSSNQKLNEMLDQLRKDDLVLIKSFSNVTTSLQELRDFLYVVHNIGGKIDLLKKASGEQIFCSDEGYKYLEQFLILQAQMESKKNKILITSDTKKEKLLSEIYSVFLRQQEGLISSEQAAEELQINVGSYYKYAQQLNT